MISRHLLKRAFATAKANIPIVDISNFLANPNQAINDCNKVAEAFRETSCLLIKDPRVNQKQIDAFIDLMETYFESRAQRYDNNDKNLKDFYPEFGFQTGACPDFVFVMKDYSHVHKNYGPMHKPQSNSPPIPDAKWRFLWRIGERIDKSEHYTVDPPVHIPEDFPQWKEVMDRVGNLLLNGIYSVSEMLALGLGLERTLFKDLMINGPQFLSPNGSNLKKYDVGTPLSSFHYDLNFLTIHGKNRYPGLDIWLKNGEKKKVSVPEGHLLLQVGKQLEMLTGGYLHSGFHEVIATQEAKDMAKVAEKEGRSTWRINTTMFASTRPEVILKPLDKFATEESMKAYPPILTQTQMEEEFKDMNMTQEKFLKVQNKKSVAH